MADYAFNPPYKTKPHIGRRLQDMPEPTEAQKEKRRAEGGLGYRVHGPSAEKEHGAYGAFHESPKSAFADVQKRGSGHTVMRTYGLFPSGHQWNHEGEMTMAPYKGGVYEVKEGKLVR